tara:strand:+ start:628 stop:795 length:168 start_codon:yes stop_codon:yes gene_type:complete
MESIIDEQEALLIIQEELIRKLKFDIKILNFKLLYLKETCIKKKVCLYEFIAEDN